MSKKLTALSLDDKIKIIEAVNRNVNKKELTATYNCDISTINRIIKNAHELRSLAASNNNLKRKRLRKSSHETVEKALNLWFDEVRQQSGNITSSLLLEKAREFATVVDKDFCPDLNWVWRWRQRQGIQIKKRQKETTEINTDADTDYQKFLLPEILSNYTTENIFSANETALYYKALPNTTQAKAAETSTGQKQQQQSRMTLLLLCNATGGFRQLFAIGKPKNPNSFRNRHVPVKYFSNQNAWMTSNIWNEILKTLDEEMVAKERKIVLLVNNVACHKKHVNLKNIKVEYLPVYTGAVIQPIELGVSHAFKMHYRKIIVRRQLFALEKGKTVKEFCQSITILNALQIAKTAWDAVTSRKISNCFKKAGLISGAEECESEEDIEMLSYSSKYVHCDSLGSCYGSLEEEEILKTVMNKVTTSDTEEENLPPKEKPPSIKEALLSLEILEKFCQANAIDYGIHTNTLENKIFNLLVKKLGPAKIKQFFKIPLE